MRNEGKEEEMEGLKERWREGGRDREKDRKLEGRREGGEGWKERMKEG